MASEILAFIDEAGCSGDKFGHGSSEFLIMAAVVFRADKETEALGCFAKGDGPSAKKVCRKFSKSSDKDRFSITKTMAASPIRVIQVALHKPSMNAPHIRSNHGHEYNYLFKMTLERISWFVRDHYQREPGKDRTVAVTLSEQKMYPYSDMLSYMKRLRGGGHNCSVEWDFVDPSLAVTPHVDETPIHLADFAASALAMACEPKQHEMTDDRFQRNLSPVIYKRRAHGVTKHYGLKFFPGGVEAELQKQGRLDFLKLMG